MKVLKPSGKILFREVQQFRQMWLWAILISATLIPLILVAVLAPRDKSISTVEMAGVIAVLSGTFLLNVVVFYITKLETIVTDDGVFYRWWPFVKRYSMLPWKDIATVIVKKYPYLQYGYHFSKEFGKVHNIDGNRGIQFYLIDGKKVFIGTQKLTALQHTLEQMKPVEVQLK